ncbi:hypothetical protein E4H04_03680 [Candidatus Bathyarchaeota archaeon]|nr:MAG: hypothetical protein E4H04_03680 [Candidatus Bathyarchaeota archaeon]
MINDEMGSIDYVIEDKDGKKLIRVLVNEENRMAPAYVDNIRAIIMDLDEKKYDEALILTNRITNSAYELVAERENLEVITPTMKNNFSLKELLSAVQMKASRICMRKCGKAPETKEDCKGKNGREYDCEIRRISDDAKFHATMKWEIVLLEDFNNLCELEKTMLALN